MRLVGAIRVVSLASAILVGLLWLTPAVGVPARAATLTVGSAIGSAVNTAVDAHSAAVNHTSVVGTVRWTTTTVNVRGHPTVANKPLFVLAPQTPVRIVRFITDPSRRTWYLVQVHSRLGWLAAWLTHGRPVGHTAPATTWLVARASSFGIGDGLLGAHMACGDRLTSSILAVANLRLPCGTSVRLRLGRHAVTAKVLDRGPYVVGRTFDLGPAVCRALGGCDGVMTISWQVVH